MKKILYIFPILAIAACIEISCNSRMDSNGQIINGEDANTYLETIEINNNKHEFVVDGYGLSHWPDCKYCKN